MNSNPTKNISSFAKVSVIIPIYNTGNYLSDALDSICNQTLKELEIILINDGSTDNSQHIINEYAQKDNRIQWHQQPNYGLSVARNIGLQYATGEYIYFMDSDDILDAIALEQCYELCQKENLDFAFFDAETSLEVTAQIPNYDRRKNIAENKIWNGIELLNYELQHHLFLSSVWLCFTNHSFLKKSFSCFPPGVIHEDHVFALQIHLHAQRVAYIPQFFFKRRVRANSIMSSMFSMRNIEGYTTVCSLIKSLEALHPEWIIVIEEYLSQTFNAIVWLAHKMPILEKFEVFFRLKRMRFSHYITFKNWLVFWFK